jgi:hypothetical protein
MPVFRPHQKKTNTMTEDCSIVVILSKNKASPKGCSVRPTPFFLPTKLVAQQALRFRSLP